MSTPAFLQAMLANEKAMFVRVVQAVVEPGLEHRLHGPSADESPLH